MDKVESKLDENCEKITAEYHPLRDWVNDEVGYFLIKLNKESKTIEAGFCKEGNVIQKLFTGKDATVLYNAINTAMKLSHQHIAYLAREFVKAEVALALGIDYTQDEALDLRGFSREQVPESIEDPKSYLKTRSVL